MTQPLHRRTLLSALLGTALPWGIGQSRAQAAPELKPLQFIVPTPPGSQPDFLARWLSEPIGRQAGLSAKVDALAIGGMDEIEMPAFLRKQAD